METVRFQPETVTSRYCSAVVLSYSYSRSTSFPAMITMLPASITPDLGAELLSRVTKMMMTALLR